MLTWVIDFQLRTHCRINHVTFHKHIKVHILGTTVMCCSHNIQVHTPAIKMHITTTGQYYIQLYRK